VATRWGGRPCVVIFKGVEVGIEQQPAKKECTLFEASRNRFWQIARTPPMSVSRKYGVAPLTDSQSMVLLTRPRCRDELFTQLAH
jgi:hypothetical protein